MRAARFWLTELAFAVDKLKSWRERLQSHGVAIEGERAWSVYFRGPDGHLVELAMPGVGNLLMGIPVIGFQPNKRRFHCARVNSLCQARC